MNSYKSGACSSFHAILHVLTAVYQMYRSTAPCENPTFAQDSQFFICFARRRSGISSRQKGTNQQFSKSEVGGENRSEAEAPTGNPSPAPSTRTARIARTTRQINGAKFLVGGAKVGGLPCSASVTETRPEWRRASRCLLVHFRQENLWFSSGHGFVMLESPCKNKGFVNFVFESTPENATRLMTY